MHEVETRLSGATVKPALQALCCDNHLARPCVRTRKPLRPDIAFFPAYLRRNAERTASGSVPASLAISCARPSSAARPSLTRPASMSRSAW